MSSHRNRLSSHVLGIACLLIAVALLLSGSAQAATTFVAPGAQALSGAITAAAAGDTLYLGGGTYTESAPITIAKALVIQGAGYNQTFVKIAGSSLATPAILVTVPNVAIGAVAIDPSSIPGGLAIQVAAGANNFTLANSKVSNFLAGVQFNNVTSGSVDRDLLLAPLGTGARPAAVGSTNPASLGVSIQNQSSGVVVFGGLIERFNRGVFIAAGSTGNTVQAVLIDYSGDAGIRVEGSGNKIGGTTSAGYNAGNLIKYNVTDGISIFGNSNTISRNTSSSNGRYGIFLDAGTTGNTGSGNTGTGNGAGLIKDNGTNTVS